MHFMLRLRRLRQVALSRSATSAHRHRVSPSDPSRIRTDGILLEGQVAWAACLLDHRYLFNSSNVSPDCLQICDIVPRCKSLLAVVGTVTNRRPFFMTM